MRSLTFYFYSSKTHTLNLTNFHTIGQPSTSLPMPGQRGHHAGPATEFPRGALSESALQWSSESTLEASELVRRKHAKHQHAIHHHHNYHHHYLYIISKSFACLYSLIHVCDSPKYKQQPGTLNMLSNETKNSQNQLQGVPTSLEYTQKCLRAKRATFTKKLYSAP